MAGMQRFVTYIYAYEDGQKSSNAGYARIEIRGNNGRIEIHFASDSISGGEGAVGFLYIEEGKLISIPLGAFHIENGRGMGQFTFRTETIQDTNHSFDRIDGIGITDSNGQKYMSFWKDVEVPSVDAIEEPEPQMQPVMQTEPQTQGAGLAQKEIIEDAEQESLHTMEIPMRNIFPNYSIEDIWNNMQKSRQCVQVNEEICAIQIELSDLRELPRKYWYLGNNSFLLHGFFNYHHLLLGKLQNGKWFLGVPGVYERQEHVIASVFGFPGFMPATENDNAREMQQGIWYHMLED